MVGSFRGAARSLLAASVLVSLGGCASYLPSFSGGSPEPAPAPMAAPIPSNIRSEDLVGRWGLAAYHRDADRARTEAAARGQCKLPFVINRSSTGVSMLGHDSPQVQDMLVKGSAEGKTYIGPNPQSGDPDDREVVSFDGRVLVMRWVDPEVAGRYGTMVLVRCGAEGTTASRGPRPAPAPAVPR
ncbi:hypothetical protein [Rhodoplanes roseus]|uniref:hypothetical protein n=1 Tax=Rhodoplanes roseus TaxID=29409 RepID=UPI001FE0217D|nr:hypothetical protein [Rhodoplanes roseus]